MLVRVRASGICHSDAHYRAGRSSMGQMPITLGHEVAGEVEWVGTKVTNVKAGDRVCLHYNISCGNCYYCRKGHEQFCATVRMIGHHIDGGYAEYIAVPARNAIPLPEEISFDEGDLTTSQTPSCCPASTDTRQAENFWARAVSFVA